MAKGQAKAFQPVLEKIDECDFFLGLMEQYETKPREFGFCLSAYLSAFNSIVERLKNTVPENSLRKEARKALADLQQSAPEVNFLVRARNVEVHRDGVRIELARRRDPSTHKLPRPRVGPRFAKFEDPLWTRPGRRTRKDWVFCDKPKPETITLCRNSLKQLQQLVSELAETTQSAKPG